MAMLGKIRRMLCRDNLSLSEISRRTSVPRNTLKKWLRAPGDAEPKYRRQPSDKLVAPFAAQLKRRSKLTPVVPKPTGAPRTSYGWKSRFRHWAEPSRSCHWHPASPNSVRTTTSVMAQPPYLPRSTLLPAKSSVSCIGGIAAVSS